MRLLIRYRHSCNSALPYHEMEKVGWCELKMGNDTLFIQIN